MKSGLNCLLAVWLAGCATYQPQPLSPARSEAAFRSRSLEDDGLRRFAEKNSQPPPVQWPPRECDLQLLTLIAFYFHPDLDVARAKLRNAQAASITAGERPNPTVTLLPEYSINPEAGVTPWVLGFSFDVPIETAGKRAHRLEQARNLGTAARFSLGETFWKIRSQLRSSLLEHLLARREAGLWERETAIRTNLVSLLTRRLEEGEASSFEVNVARTELLNAQISSRAAHGRISESLASLATATGLPVTALEKLDFRWPDLPAPPPAGQISVPDLQSVGLLNRLDIRRSLAEYAAAEAALHLEIAKQYPDLHLSPGYLFDQGQHKFSFGPTIALPILNQNQGAIAGAKARRQEAAAFFLALQSQIIGDTELASIRYRNAHAELQETQSTLGEIQAKTERSQQRALELGESDRVALAAVQLQGSLLARAQLDALRKTQAALGALENAVQRPLSPADSIRFSNLTISQPENP